MQETVDYFCGDELSAKVFIDKYALRDKNSNLIEMTPDEMHHRLAKEFARVEKNKFAQPYSEDFLYGLFKDFAFVIPQGSPMFGIGNPFHNVSLSNCYVVESPEDSYGGICRADEHLVQISKRRGGIGLDLSHLRPVNTPTTNAARTSSGIVAFMERYSNSINEVAQNGRRGALMLTINVHHPEVLNFANAKKNRTKVTGANISVRLTDDFLKAVLEGGQYEQRWPVDTSSPQLSVMTDARTIWKELIHNAWENAEPGLLFWNAIVKESPADCYKDFGFETICTNPCSELPLCANDSCRLLLLNLFSYVDDPFTLKAKWNNKKYKDHCYVAQRLMDDLIDLELECIDRIISKIENDPEYDSVKVRELHLWQSIRIKCENGRRTGTGITAIGDAMASLGIRYGSDESIEFTDKVYKALKLECYRSSVDMAEELGAFPLWQASLESDCPFLIRIKKEDRELYDRMQKIGRRNIALLTTAPAGSVSIVSGPRPYFQTTSGIEPLFQDKPYTRRKKINANDSSSRVDFVDENGVRWQEFTVFHSKLKMWMDITGETDWTKSPYHGCCAEDLDWKQRVKLQAAAQRHVDHAISSTLNLPEDVSEEKVAEIYETAWKAGCKGVTVYRKNCRSGVLVDSKPKIPKTNAPKRPGELPCDVHFSKNKGEEFIVLVGLYENEPYEVLAGSAEGISKSNKTGIIKKIKRGQYQLICSGSVVCDDVNTQFSDEQEAITRLVSTALRHGSSINFIVHQLEKVKGDMMGFAKSLSRVLKKYIKDGTKITGETCGECNMDSLVRSDGCSICKNCGWSKCS